MIKAVVFDYNGTLADDAKKTNLAVNYALKNLGLSSLSLDEYKEKFELPPAKFFSKLGIKEENELKKAWFYFSDYLKKYKEKAILFGGVKETLIHLKKNNIQIVILTTYLEDLLETELKETGIDNLIDLIITEHIKVKALCDYIKGKQLKGNEVLCIGDTEYDIYAGKECGMITIGFTRGYKSKNDLELVKPDYLINDFKKILEILKEN